MVGIIAEEMKIKKKRQIFRELSMAPCAVVLFFWSSIRALIYISDKFDIDLIVY